MIFLFKVLMTIAKTNIGLVIFTMLPPLAVILYLQKSFVQGLIEPEK